MGAGGGQVHVAGFLGRCQLSQAVLGLGGEEVVGQAVAGLVMGEGTGLDILRFQLALALAAFDVVHAAAPF